MKNSFKKQEVRKFSLALQKWIRFLIVFFSVAILTLSLTEYSYSDDQPQSPQEKDCALLQQSGAIEQELIIEKLKPDPNNPNNWIPVSTDSITVPSGEHVTVKNPFPQNYIISYACFGIKENIENKETLRNVGIKENIENKETLRNVGIKENIENKETLRNVGIKENIENKETLRNVGIQLNKENAEHISLRMPTPLILFPSFPKILFPKYFFREEGNLYLVGKPLTIQTSTNMLQYGKEIELTISDPTQQVNWQIEPAIGTLNSTGPSAKTIYTAPPKADASGKNKVIITASKEGHNLSSINVQLIDKALPLSIHASSDTVQYGQEIKLTLSDISQKVNWRIVEPIEPDGGTIEPKVLSSEAIYKAPTEDNAHGITQVKITAAKEGQDLLPITIRLTKTSSDTEQIVFVRKGIFLSPIWPALIAAFLIAGIAYVIIALAVFIYLHPQESTHRSICGTLKDFVIDKNKCRYLNPIVITSGTFGKASLSRLQLLGFTIIVIGLLVYLLILTGNLSDLSSDVLVLLGVSAAGTVGTGAVQIINKRLSFENWAWVRNQGWLTVGEKGHTEKANPEKHARWKDLILDENGTLNVYNFQLALASLLVAAFLILSGGNSLAGFAMPKGFPELLGLSNLFYVLGRAVEPQSFSELNKILDELRALDEKLHQELRALKQKSLEEGSQASSQAINHLESYEPYLKKAQLVAVMLKTVFSDVEGTKFDKKKLPIPDNDLLPFWAKNLTA